MNPDRSKKVALLEDGIPFGPAPYSAPAAYYFPIMTRMTAVRVIKGPAAISYGPQTIGGAIDLVTRPIPATTSGGFDVAGGQYGYNKLHGWAGTSNDKIGFLVDGIHLGSTGFKDLPNGADTGFARNEWMVKGAYTFDTHRGVQQELRVKASYSDEVSNETYVGITDADLRRTPFRRYGASQLDRMENHRTAFEVAYVLDPQPNMKLTVTLYRHDFDRSWRKANHFRGVDLFDVVTNPTTPTNAVYAAILRGDADGATSREALFVGPNHRVFTVTGLETRIRVDAATGPIQHRMEYGVRLHQDVIERRHSEDAFNLVGGRLVPEGSPTIVTGYNEASTEALAIHAIDAATWGPLTFTPGVRVEAMHSSFTDKAAGTPADRQLTQVLLPGAGAYYALTRSFGALGGVYRGFSPTVPGSGPSARPELSVNYEAGARFSRGRTRAEVIGFYNDYSNMTDVCTLSSGCSEASLDRQYDAGSARIYGVEAFADHTLPVGAFKIPFNAAYTLTRATFGSTFSSEDPIYGNVRAGDEVPYVPRHQWNASTGVEHARAGASVGATYLHAMRERAGSEKLSNTLATDTVFTIDVSAYFRVFDTVRIYLNVRNLLDDHSIVGRRPYGARPNAPRWAQIGAKFTF